MKDKILVTFFVITLVFITSCDNSPEGGNAAGFGTVYVYADFDSDLYAADARTCTDETADDGMCDSCFFVDEDLEITIASTAYETLPEGVTASAILIESYLVQFTPRETDSPSLPNKAIQHHIEVQAGSSVTFPLRVFDQEDKSSWWAAYVASGTVAYEYTVTISIQAEEVTTGNSETIQVQFPVDYFDINDECT